MREDRRTGAREQGSKGGRKGRRKRGSREGERRGDGERGKMMLGVVE